MRLILAFFLIDIIEKDEIFIVHFNLFVPQLANVRNKLSLNFHIGFIKFVYSNSNNEY